MHLINDAVKYGTRDAAIDKSRDFLFYLIIFYKQHNFLFLFY